MTGVGQYVELLKEKTLKLHEKVLDTKKILIDNKIDVDRHFQECKELLSLMTERDDMFLFIIQEITILTFYYFTYRHRGEDSLDRSDQISVH